MINTNGKRAIDSIRRNGLRSFIQNSIFFRLCRYLRNVRLAIVCGIDNNLPFDIQWPNISRFLPLKPISSSALEGKPSICLVTVNMSSGGAERQVAALASELKRLGHEVRVRVSRLDGENGHYLSYLKDHGIDICVPKMPGFSDVAFMKQQGVDISLIKHLPAELRTEALALALDLLRQPVDIVHCYLDWSCCYGGFAALLSGTPCVRFSWRNVNPTYLESFRDWMPLLYKFLLLFSHIKVENNTFSGAIDYTRWLELPPGKVEVIPNGISPELFRFSLKESGSNLRQTFGIVPEAPLVVSIGRLTAQKRPLDLPDIIIALRKNLPLATFIHIGSGPLKNDLQKRITSLGLAGSSQKKGRDAGMVLLGRRNDAFEILRISDVLLLTSAYEGMPNVIMEAMLAGVPVVATRVGGVADVMHDGVHGFLHDVGDITGMVQSLERLLIDPALRKRMGNAGRLQILSKFTINHLTDRITRAYISQCSIAK